MSKPLPRPRRKVNETDESYAARYNAYRDSCRVPANDFRFSQEGSIVILRAISHDAKTWVLANLPDDRQVWGNDGTVVEWRYFPAILEGIQNDGLTIKEQA